MKYLIFILLLGCASQKGDYFVSTDGNDMNNGKTLKTAWKTIDKLNEQSFTKDDTIVFMDGDYSGELKVNSGTYLSYGKSSLNGRDSLDIGIDIVGNGVTIDNLRLQNFKYAGIQLKRCYNGVIKNCTIKNIGIHSPDHTTTGFRLIGVSMDYCDSITVSNIEIDSIGYIGIGYSQSNRILIEDNRIKNYCLLVNDGGGIYADYCSSLHVLNYKGCTWKNNLIEGSVYSDTLIHENVGLYLDYGCSHHTIENNNVSGNLFNIFIGLGNNILIRNNTTFGSCSRYAWGAELNMDAYNPEQKVENNLVQGNYLITDKKQNYNYCSYPVVINNYQEGCTKFDENYFHVSCPDSFVMISDKNYTYKNWILNGGNDILE